MNGGVIPPSLNTFPLELNGLFKFLSALYKHKCDHEKQAGVQHHLNTCICYVFFHALNPFLSVHYNLPLS